MQYEVELFYEAAGPYEIIEADSMENAITKFERHNHAYPGEFSSYRVTEAGDGGDSAWFDERGRS